MYRDIIHEVKDRETITRKEFIKYFKKLNKNTKKFIESNKDRMVKKRESNQYIKDHLTANFRLIIYDKEAIYAFTFFLVDKKPAVFDYDVTNQITKSITDNNCICVRD